MNRIATVFNDLKNKRPVFMPFVVGGDPDFKRSLEILLAVANTADILEVGFPYSDPLADGPVIQGAGQRALLAGITPVQVFKLIKRVRIRYPALPIVILAYANLVHASGTKKFCKLAKRAGVDGVLIPDIPVEEAHPYIRCAKQAKLDQILLVTQTTTNQRLKLIAEHATGFLYVVSVLGVTGQRKNITSETIQLLKRVKRKTKLPLAVGFGVSSRAQGHALYEAGADGYIVGSALVKVVGKYLDNKNLIKKIDRFVNDLKFGK